MARILRRRVVKPTRAPDKRVSPQEINQWLQLGLSTAKIAEVLGGALIPESKGKTTESEAIADLYARSQKGPAQREYERQLREGTQLPESPLTPQLAQPAPTQQLPPRTQEVAPSDQGASIKDQIFQGQYVRDEEVFPPVETRTPQERIDAKARRLFALSMRPNRGFEERRVEEIDFPPEGVNAPGGYVLDDETFTELGVAQSIKDRIDERAGEILTRPDRFRLQGSPSVGTLARPSDGDVESLANEFYRESFTGGQSGMSFKTAWEQAYQALSAGHQETLAGMEFEEAQAIARKELGVIDRMEADWGAGWTDESSQPQPPPQDVAVTWDEAQAQARAEVEEEDRQLELEQSERQERGVEIVYPVTTLPMPEGAPPTTETGMVPSPPTQETKQQVISTLQGLYAAMRQAKTFEEGAALLRQLDDIVKPEGILETIGYGMGKKRDQAYKTALKYLKRSSPENEKGYAKLLAKQRADSRKRQDQIDKEGRGEARQAKKEGRAETRQVDKEARQLASDIDKEGRLWKKFTKQQKVRLEDNKTLTRLKARLRPGRQGRRSVKESLMLSGVLDATKKVTRAEMNEAKWEVEVKDKTAALDRLGPDALTDERDALKAAVKLARTEKRKATAEKKAAERRGNELLGRTPAALKAPPPAAPPPTRATGADASTEDAFERNW